MYDLIKTALEVHYPFNMIIVLGSLGILLVIISVIATEVRKFASHRLELEIKREMIGQGMSAEEIERVIEAGGKSGRSEKNSKA